MTDEPLSADETERLARAWTGDRGPGLSAAFRVPGWLEKSTMEMYAHSFGFVFGPRVPLTRRQRIRYKARDRWYEVRHWLASKICPEDSGW